MEDKLPRGLYAIVDDSVCPERPLAAKVLEVLEGGCRVVQLRLKHTGDRDALALVQALVPAARAHGAVLLVNDRVDLALLGGAHGVHVGKADVPVDVARRVLGPAAVIGATVRTRADIEAAAADGASYVGLGPVFATTTKSLSEAPIGLEGLATVARGSPVPVVAISGITLATIGAVGRGGAHAAAVAADLFSGGEARTRVRALHEAFFGG